MSGAELAAAAEGLVGSRFRLHGRGGAGGLDCIGLFVAAMAAIDRPVTVPSGYPLRLNRLDCWLPDPAGYGFAPAKPPFLPGDVIMLQPGPAQFHLAIAARDGGWVHAHAGLRCVIHSPALPEGRLVKHWRPAPTF